METFVQMTLRESRILCSRCKDAVMGEPGFDRAKHLVTTVRSHKGFEPYKCDQCGRVQEVAE